MNRRIGLALASGGARGAYQAGALLAMAERGITFQSVAGTSIGSLNGAFYCQGDGSVGHMEDLCRLWRETPEAGLIAVDAQSIGFSLLKMFVQTELPTFTKWAGRLSGRRAHLCDPRPVEAFLKKWIRFDDVVASEREFYIAMLPSLSTGLDADPLLEAILGPWLEATYIRASALSPEELKNALLAAAAIPLAFPSQEIKGRKYSDAAMRDPLPSGVLKEAGCDWICSIFLSDAHIQNRADYPGATLLQVRPSEVIDPNLMSMLDFSRESVDRLINLGYSNACDVLKEAQDFMDLIIELKVSGTRLEGMTEGLHAKPKLTPW